MTFEENLKRICKDRGTTPTAIMKKKKWGLSTSKVSAWYKGSLPKQEVLIRLAEELNCSVMDFFADEEDLIEKEIVPNNEDEKDILRIYRSLPRRAKHEFMAMVYEYENRRELEGIIQVLRVEKIIPIELLKRKRILEVILRKR